ncbi:metal tolerance protein C2-like isoform X1 [Cucurbita moschata]|uniref:Metal tolerance protein C2-like isoform X1 n=1 Tax=Cucurbita moschata TaxID=3662 RepID=A0A6J1EVR2_CUCMO|nr:metal tolerance protein C2-like isoform X1 [Cucurbita moschata]XP_022929926.1 metal tolerance protein C2-like isoform X1 [Cucurbita moschata]XP_022929975.1 metal tolerance protein C2-like isoform X1 [Cucurbita moschata]
MDRIGSFNHHTASNGFQNSCNRDTEFGANDRRFAFSRQASSMQWQEPSHPPISTNSDELAKPLLSRSMSSINIPPGRYFSSESNNFFGVKDNSGDKLSVLSLAFSILENVRSGNLYMKRLFIMIFLNVLYSTAELATGLLSGRIGLVSDAFHLTFGCGLLTFSLFSIAASRSKPDHVYTYGYKRLEVLAAFTNALFLLFLSFSLAVEALHAYIQDESEHKHYLIVSAVTNLTVNLIGVWFFRNYARINLVYRKAEDMNYHSICLHVLADSIRSAGLILASWFLSLGVQNAEVLCLGLVSVAVFMIVMPLFRATGGVLLQMVPPSIPTSALSKCLRQITSLEDVLEVTQARFWELVPGQVVGSLSLTIKKGTDNRQTLEFVHGVYHELGILELTVQIEDA